jgi:hypothetical protein
MLQPITLLIAAIAVGLLAWSLWRHLAADDAQRLSRMRRPSSRINGTAELVDGTRHVPVAMSLTSSTLFYENADMSASVDLDCVQEVEYEHELATGTSVERGTVLRLRCFSKVFEFVVDSATVPQWQAVLPPVRMET